MCDILLWLYTINQIDLMKLNKIYGYCKWVIYLVLYFVMKLIHVIKINYYRIQQFRNEEKNINVNLFNLQDIYRFEDL